MPRVHVVVAHQDEVAVGDIVSFGFSNHRGLQSMATLEMRVSDTLFFFSQGELINS